MKDITPNKKQSFWDKHSDYFSSIWTISMFIGFVYAFFDWIRMLFESASDQNIIGFLLVFVLQTFYMGLSGVTAAIILTILIVIITIIPYLVIRGLTK